MEDKYGKLTAGTYRIRFEPQAYNKNFSFGTTLKVKFTLDGTTNSKANLKILQLLM